MFVNISMKFHEDIMNGFQVQSGNNFVTETATYEVQRSIAKKYISKSYDSCALHIV